MEHRTPARPRVILADDNIAFLEWVGPFLTGAFDVVARASDGRQALDLVSQLRPDVIVLDVSMPKLDGFQTLAHLRRESPETRAVFLTMHRDDAFVAAAINAGAHGYVVKSRVHLDLLDAIEHALAGRMFVPSLTSLATVAGSRHTAHFYGDDSDFLNSVSELVGATLRAGAQVVLITREATRSGVAQRLRARQMDLALFAERGQYVEQDSALALSQVMHNGRPDRGRLAEMMHGLERLRLAGPNGPHSRLTIFGDMTVTLCRNGNFETALEIERIWQDLTRPMPFFTVCSYPIEWFQHSAGRNQLARLCAEHSGVTH